MGDIEKLINANSFAVIGASKHKEKVGHIIFKNLLKSNSKVFPVNKDIDKILEQRVYSDLFEIPYKVDCAIIATPAETALDLFKQTIKKGIKSVVIISSGFSEIGNEDLENEIDYLAEKYSINLLGPNSFGFINTNKNINTTFFEGEIKKGNIAFISQSGAIASVVLDKKEKLSGFVSVGNSSQTDFSDYIEYYSKDKNTKVICLYMESLKKHKGTRFLEVCKKCKKPIVVLKAGKSEKGKKAAQTHTAALASPKEIFSGVFKQAEIIEVDSIEELFQTANILEKYPCLKNRTCVVTNAGGPGVLTSDSFEENEIKIPELPKKIILKLNKVLPANWSRNNPVDILGDGNAGRYAKTLQILNKKSFFDFYTVLLTPQYQTQPLETAKLLTLLKKPVIACFMGGEKINEAKTFLEKNNIPLFDDPREMGEVLGKVF